MKDVKALIITGFGLNCDNETAHAFELAGAQPHRVHINELISGEVSLADFHILAFGGGFSWGDDHGAGVILALKLKKHIGKDLLQFIEDGKLIIGICNGFQALANLGLLPGLNGSYTDRSVSITYNDTGFRDHWVKLAANENSPCVFTKELGVVDYPIRHGEGKVIADADVIKGLVENNQVVFQYAKEDGSIARGEFPANPNGSLEDIAGICDATGRIFGLMPHPEAFNHVTNHPDWTRMREQARREGRPLDTGETVGIKLFRNGVEYIRDHF